MRSKRIFFFIFLLYLLYITGISVNAAEIYKDKLSNNIIGASHKAPGKTLKVVVQKGSEKYTYELRNDGGKDYYPLQLGTGIYKVSVLENVSGTKYAVLKTEDVNVNVTNQNTVYLQSIQIINFSSSDPPIKKAKALASHDKIYDYIVKNIKYDYNKAATVKPGYFPIINDTFQTNLGICYDYSSMDAAMLRSLGIPAKLIKGYAKGVEGYHAWNEVLLNGTWYVIDTTYDAQSQGKKVAMKKKSSDYEKVYEY